MSGYAQSMVYAVDGVAYFPYASYMYRDVDPRTAIQARFAPCPIAATVPERDRAVMPADTRASSRRPRRRAGFGLDGPVQTNSGFG